MEKKYKLILITILLGVFMTSLDATIVSVALPTIAKSMGEAGHNTSNISWVLLIYTLMLCCFILLWSKIGTNKGYKKVFVCGIAIFTVSSLAIGLCGMNTSLGLGPMIIFRAVQGIGAGMSIAVSLAMVSAYLPAEIKGAGIASVTLASSVGTAFGPVLGGILTSIDWPWIFYVNIPIGIICLFMCWKYMDVEENLPAEKSKIDYIGAALLFIMMFALIMYLNRGSEIGWMSDKGIALLVTTFVAAGLVAWWEGRTKDPLMSLRLIKDINITKANLIGLIVFMAMGGSYLLLPYFLGIPSEYGGQGYSTIEYGLILVSTSAGMMLVGLFVGKYSDRTGDNRTPTVIGMAISALAFIMMSLGFNSGAQLWYIIVTLVIWGAGVGMSIIGSANLAFSFIHEGEDGQLSGLSQTFRQAGSSAGVAILEAVFTAGVVLVPTIDIVPGLKHAFFVAAIIALIGFVVAMSCKNKKDLDKA